MHWHTTTEADIASLLLQNTHDTCSVTGYIYIKPKNSVTFSLAIATRKNSTNGLQAILVLCYAYIIFCMCTFLYVIMHIIITLFHVITTSCSFSVPKRMYILGILIVL